jgi:hypothetical protein
LARSNFELKIINLFDSSSFVYFKKPCSTGFWEILFYQNPEPKKSRTEKIMTGVGTVHKHSVATEGAAKCHQEDG